MQLLKMLNYLRKKNKIRIFMELIIVKIAFYLQNFIINLGNYIEVTTK